MMELRRNFASFVIALFAVFSLSAVAYVKFNNQSEYNFFKELYNPPKSSNTYMARLDVNSYISQKAENLTQYQKVIDFYTQFTKNAKISEAILKYSLEYDMPVNLAFALSYVESDGFNIKAYRHNTNGTIDRGLFQLNNGHRRSWKITDYYDIEKNCKEGIRFWSEDCYETDRSIPMTLIAYNGGPWSDNVLNGIIPENRVDYVNDILSYEDMLNVAFNKFIRG